MTAAFDLPSCCDSTSILRFPSSRFFPHSHQQPDAQIPRLKQAVSNLVHGFDSPPLVGYGGPKGAGGVYHQLNEWAQESQGRAGEETKAAATTHLERSRNNGKKPAQSRVHWQAAKKVKGRNPNDQEVNI
ncbi:uncharacterized protein G2W53_033967 [Senna tora]|uniref:Uncharacterized protein n=1 Tax=Senna tora TaxID=362788 RepID=A0A834WBG7_9FABA|nr:uncharacterized protein G2W53_033967 [Senna tora]